MSVNQIRPAPLVWVVVLEGLVLSIFVTSLYLEHAELVALSALWGGVLFVIPNTYFMIYAFRLQGATRMLQVAQSFRKGLMGKLILTALGFGMVFYAHPNVLPGVMFGTYIFLLIVHIGVAAALSNYCYRQCSG